MNQATRENLASGLAYVMFFGGTSYLISKVAELPDPLPIQLSLIFGVVIGLIGVWHLILARRIPLGLVLLIVGLVVFGRGMQLHYYLASITLDPTTSMKLDAEVDAEMKQVFPDYKPEPKVENKR